MREPFDIAEFVHFASQPGATAPYVREAMSLRYSTSYINRLMKRYVGERPTQKSVERPNLLRDAVVAYMESKGLPSNYCSRCGRVRTRGGAIHSLRRANPTLDDFVFVCTKGCAAPGDF